MKVINFFVKLISSLFVLIFGLLCLTTTVFLLINNMTSQENVTNYVKNANIFDYSSRDVISDSNNNTLRYTIKSNLLTVDIPALVVDEVIDSEELDILISEYIYDYSQYLLYNADKPAFPSNGILNILMDKYSNKEGKELSEKQKEKTLDYIELLGNKIDQGVLEKNEINEMISLNIVKQVANLFTSRFMPIVLFLIMTTLIAIISICLNSLKKAINWCSKITVLDGLLLIIASFVEVRVLIMYFNNQGLIDSLIISIVENGFQNMLVYGIILIIIGIIFMTISAILLKKEQKYNNKNNEFAGSITEKQDNNAKLTKDKIDKQNDKPMIRDSEVLQEIPIINDNQQENKINNETNQEESKEEDLPTSQSIENKTISTKESESQSEEQDVVNKKESNYNGNNEEKMQVIPVSEEENEEEQDEPITSEIELEEVEKTDDEENNLEIESEDYSEISDDNKEDEEIKKEEKDISPLKEIKVDVTYPKKGKDIEFNLSDKTEEEEIELL